MFRIVSTGLGRILLCMLGVALGRWVLISLGVGMAVHQRLASAIILCSLLIYLASCTSDPVGLPGRGTVPRRHYDWQAISTGSQKYLYSVWGTAPNNVYVGGALGTFLHYDGIEWDSISIDTSINVYDIWGTGENNVYAVGSEGAAYHYDGAQWTRMATETQTGLRRVWGFDSTRVYAAGDDGLILQCDGQQWTAIDSGGADIYGMWGCRDVIYPTLDIQLASLMSLARDGEFTYFDGMVWHRLSSMPAITVNGLWVGSWDHVYAVASNYRMYHYDGFRWTTPWVPVTTAYYCVWGLASNDVFAAGAYGMIAHYNGQGWRDLDNTDSRALYDIWAGESGHVFAVGQYGRIVIGTPTL